MANNDFVKQIVEGIQKQLGSQEEIQLMSSKGINIPRISSGIYALDYILGGGLPVGKVIELFGDEGSGKTTVALHAIAKAQKLGGIAAFIDLENGLNIDYAQTLGVDIDSLMVSQPESGNSAMEVVMKIMEQKADIKELESKPLVIVVDSAAALVTLDEQKGDVGDTQVSPVARLLSTVLRRMVTTVRKTGTILIFTNQMRDDIGSWYKTSSSTGGRALKFYSTIRIELSITKKITTSDKVVIGQMVRAKTVKNRTFPPYKEAELKVIYGQGVDNIASIVSLAIKHGIVTAKGAFYSYDDIRTQGDAKFAEELRKTPALLGKIIKELDDAR
jgi:recombination protein RecA